jgi:large subunit ribosomal protein L25
MELKANKRIATGKANGRLRRSGRLPAVVYGHRVEPVVVDVDAHEFDRVLARAGRTQLLDLVVDGGRPHKVLIKEVQRSPRHHSLVHVDFQQVSMRERLQVDVPLTVVGQVDPAVGDVDVLPVAQALKVECLPANIPEAIELDVSGLDRPDASIRAADVELPRGVTLVGDPEEVLVRLASRRAEEEAVPAPAPEAAEEGGEAEGASSE